MMTIYALLSWLPMLGYWLLIAVITLRILIKRRAVPAAMAWLLIIYIFPLIGILAYLLFGELNLGKKRALRAKKMWPSTAKWFNQLQENKSILATETSEVSRPLFQLCEFRQGIAGIKGNKLYLFDTAEETLQTLLLDIQQANQSINMLFYIWQSGGLVDDIITALIQASNRGVHCRLMLDSAGSHHFFRSEIPAIMRAAGIEVIEVLKVNILRLFLRRMDLRQHRKIVLIDNQIAYTGSMNMVDPRYFKQNAGLGQWVDLMVRAEGPIASVLSAIYSSDWEVETGNALTLHPPDHHELPFEDEKGHTVQVIASGPGILEDMIQQALLIAIYAARYQLVMTTPYLVPNDDLLHAICTAAQRGIDVSIIVPHKNDSLMVSWASRAFYTELLQAGVKIYRFNNEKGMLHSKSVLVDQQLSLVGTVNLDMRSLWLNFEITLVIDDEKFAHDLYHVQKNYLAHSEQIDAKNWFKRPLWQRGIERLFYFFSPLL